MREWTTRNIETDTGKEYKIYFAPDWNTGYFTSRMRKKDLNGIIKVMTVVQNRKPDKIAWKITKNEIYIYDNFDDNDFFHGTCKTDMNEEIFDILRNGRPEPTEWTTGQPQTVEVWST